MMRRLLDEASRVVALKSVSADGNEQLVNFLQPRLIQAGFKTQVQQVTHAFDHVSKRQFNLLGTLGDPLVDRKIFKGLLLTSHLDTAYPGLKENWTDTGQDPYAVKVVDGKVSGLGVADGKVDFLCKLYAAERFREKKLKMPIYLAGTCGAELGFFGARYLIKSVAFNPKYVAVGEPTGGRLCSAQKSMGVFKVSIGFQQIQRDSRGFNRKIDLISLGRSAHAAYPASGKNAIYQMLDFLKKSGESGFELRFTQFAGGEGVNQVPDRASSQFYLTSHQFEEFKRYAREVIKDEQFDIQLGGIGDAGVRFIPDLVFTCLYDVMAFFRQYGEELKATQDPAFTPAYSTMTLTRIHQLPAGIELYFDSRILPSTVVTDVAEEIRLGVQAISTRFSQLNLSVSKERSAPVYAAPYQSEWFRTSAEVLANLGPKSENIGVSGTTEAALFAESGYPSIVYGPGDLENNGHGPNEAVSIDQLERAVSFYSRLIEKVCM